MSTAASATNGPAGGAPAREVAADRIDPKRLVTFLAMVFGMFMAILDIQVVSASLSEIQAGLAASSSEINWVQTAYLIAEVVMIPFSGFLSRALGTRTLFTISAAGFTAASFMCGMSSTIGEMIVWRAIQGFIGGGMIPTVFASAYVIFPRSKMGVITPIIGLVATLGPTIGPTVGGYLTDALSWHWLFFINIVPGIIVAIAAFTLIDFDKPDYKLFDHFDFLGLVLMAGFLGALEYVLEEGPRNDWFNDDSVLLFAWVSGLSMIGFFVRMFTARQPIVDLKAFADRNFALGSLFSFVMGIGLYGLTLIYPLYLGMVRGYDALMIGETMFVSGLAMFFTAPVAGRLVGKVDPRKVMMAGFALFAVGTWWMTWLTADWDFYELFWPQIFRGVGLMLAMVPINNIALGTLPPERMKNASGLFNLTRNLGGAVGLALLTTILNDRTDLHLARLHESITWARKPAMEMLDNLTTRFQGAGDAQAKALAQLTSIVHRQGVVMAFSDVFFVLTLLFLCLVALAMVMKKPARPAAVGGH
jgi:MFS transporter, DHA2 family, multidrug resistance protein